MTSSGGNNNARKRESHSPHAAGRGLLACAEVSGYPAVFPVPHAQRPHDRFDVHVEQSPHLLLTYNRHFVETQAAGKGGCSH